MYTTLFAGWFFVIHAESAVFCPGILRGIQKTNTVDGKSMKMFCRKKSRKTGTKKDEFRGTIKGAGSKRMIIIPLWPYRADNKGTAITFSCISLQRMKKPLTKA
jgi:hypothetical protein